MTNIQSFENLQSNNRKLQKKKSEIRISTFIVFGCLHHISTLLMQVLVTFIYLLSYHFYKSKNEHCNDVIKIFKTCWKIYKHIHYKNKELWSAILDLAAILDFGSHFVAIFKIKMTFIFC